MTDSPRPTPCSRHAHQTTSHPIRVACALLALLGSGATHATVDLSLKLETSLGHNSNLFKDDTEGATPPLHAPLGTSTRTHAVDLGVGIPLVSDDTKLVLSTRLASLHFGSAGDVNHQTHDTQARLTWRYSDLVRGEWAVGQSRTPYPFDDTYPKLDPITRQWHMGGVTLHITPELSVPLLIGGENTQHQDQLTHGRLDVDRVHGSAGVLYKSPTGSALQVGVARTRNTYPERLASPSGPNAFTERNTDWFADAVWVISPLTQVGGRVASRLRRDNLGTPDAGRTTLYRLWAGYALSPMWRADGQWWHQPIDVTDPTVASSSLQGSSIGVTWTPSHKLTAALQLQRDRQSDRLLPGAGVGSPLNARSQRSLLRVQYQLDSGLNLFAEAAREQRTRRADDKAHQSVFRLGVDYTYENLSGATTRNARPAWPFQ
ncbi:MAG TPA: hypothetical protein VFY35_11055 [Burkholderiaceae bacterium]|nr:hypothetical protein [Burkholderiaceae bacterium]